MGAVMALIVVLLIVPYFCYRQTIVADPGNAGAYMVCWESLGRHASLLAAASLMIDYILNVAGGVLAEIWTLTSSIPALQSYTLCLAILVPFYPAPSRWLTGAWCWTARNGEAPSSIMTI